MKGRKRSYLIEWLPYSRAVYEYEQDLAVLWELYLGEKSPFRKKAYYNLWYYVLVQKHYLQKSLNLTKETPFNHPLTYAGGRLHDEY